MRHWLVENQVQKINAILRGHFNYYGLAGNTLRMTRFWNLTKREWKHSLSRRSQRGKVTWDELNEILDQHPLALPNLRINYAQLDEYVRL